MSDDKIVSLIIMLVKKCISSFSRKKNSIAFTDSATYLQTYYLSEKKMYDTDVYLKRWSDWKLPFECSLFMLHNDE